MSEERAGMRLLLHLGQPLSETRAFQQTLHRSRARMTDRGVLYPSARTDFASVYNHNPLTATFEDANRLPRELRTQFRDKPEALAEAYPRYTAELRREIKIAKPAVVILSADELFRSVRIRGFGRIVKFLKNQADTVDVVLYVQRPSENYAEAAEQAIRAGRDLPAIKSMSLSSRIDSIRTQFDGRVHLVPYDAASLSNGHLVDDFATRFVPELEDFTFDRSDAEPSLSGEALAVLSGLRTNPATDDDGTESSPREALAAMTQIDRSPPRRLRPEIAAAIDAMSDDAAALRDIPGLVPAGAATKASTAAVSAIENLSASDIFAVDAAAVADLDAALRERLRPPKELALVPAVEITPMESLEPVKSDKGIASSVRNAFAAVRNRMSDGLEEGERFELPSHPPREITLALPESFPAARVTVRLTAPAPSSIREFRFAEHLVDANGAATRDVIATMLGGIGVSHDLGETWRKIAVAGYEAWRFVHAKFMGENEYLVCAEDPMRDPMAPLDLLVIDGRGKILVQHRAHGPAWHGCRAIDMADGVVLYAEYPSGEPVEPVRVMRSADRGRTWTQVFSRKPGEIRHYHFLQARPGHPGEWWLTSGDAPHESRIWISNDHGLTWNDATDTPSTHIDVGLVRYPHTLYRLTDLVWIGDDVIWGTDDALFSTSSLIGSRVFRAKSNGRPLMPENPIKAGWHIRNMVDTGDYVFLLTQGSNLSTAAPEDKRPRVVLMPKALKDGVQPELAHLFHVDSFTEQPRAGAGFTYSRASRAAYNGTFFTYRAPFHVFPTGPHFLRWDVTFS